MKNLRDIRKLKNITQKRLSVEAEVSQETISSYEKGKTLPSVYSLCKMADYLYTSTDYLLDRTNIKSPINNLSIDGLSANEIEFVTLFKTLSKSDQNKVIGYMHALNEPK